MEQETTVFAYAVRSKSNRERGLWLFGDESNAHGFVEANADGQTKWERKGPGIWSTQDGDRRWTVKRIEIKDAIALAVQEPVTGSA